MVNPFDWDYLTTAPTSSEVLDAFTVIYLAVFLVGFVVSAYLYYRPWTQPFGRMFRRKSVIKATGVAMWIFGVGLFFFLIRLLQIDPMTLGRPIWMWLSVLALLAGAAWVALSWKSARDAATRQAATRPGHARTGAPVTQAAKRPVRRRTTHR